MNRNFIGFLRANPPFAVLAIDLAAIWIGVYIGNPKTYNGFAVWLALNIIEYTCTGIIFIGALRSIRQTRARRKQYDYWTGECDRLIRCCQDSAAHNQWDDYANHFQQLEVATARLHKEVFK